MAQAAAHTTTSAVTASHGGVATRAYKENLPHHPAEPLNRHAVLAGDAPQASARRPCRCPSHLNRAAAAGLGAAPMAGAGQPRPWQGRRQGK